MSDVSDPEHYEDARRKLRAHDTRIMLIICLTVAFIILFVLWMAGALDRATT